jgi:hypothetical protein
MRPKARAITKAKIDELSLVFKTDPATGAEFAPRNPNATMLAVKAGTGHRDPAFLDRFAKAVKGWFIGNDVEVEDNIDGDGDGAQDYEAIAWLIVNTYQDLAAGFNVMGESGRAALVVATIDTFLANLDDIRGGGEGGVAKAGARHSAADKEHIDAIGTAAAAIKEHVDALTTSGADTSSTTEEDGEEGTGADKAGKKDDADDDQGGKYGDVEYADAKNKKYPIDTKEHAKAAWSYINQKKNANKYDADELKTIKDKIKAACKKFDVEITDDKAAPVEPATAFAAGALLDNTVLVDTISGKVGEMLAAMKADIDSTLAGHAEAVDAKIAERIDAVLVPITEEVTAKSAEVSKLGQTIANMQLAEARKATAPSSGAHFNGAEFVQNGFVSETEPAPAAPTSVADVVRGARAVTAAT